jgi:hypothetical protein
MFFFFIEKKIFFLYYIESNDMHLIIEIQPRVSVNSVSSVSLHWSAFWSYLCSTCFPTLIAGLSYSLLSFLIEEIYSTNFLIFRSDTQIIENLSAIKNILFQYIFFHLQTTMYINLPRDFFVFAEENFILPFI